MTLTSIGDLSQIFTTRRLTALLRRDIERLSQEVSTGRRSQTGTPTTGDLAQILGLRREMAGLTGYRTAASEAKLAAETMQTVLERVSKAGSDASVGMVAAGLSRSSAEIASAAADARLRFVTLVDGLNAQAAGMSLFAGTARQSAAVASPELILAAISAEVAGLTSATDRQSALATWFIDPAGGFETTALLGEATAPSYRIAPGEDLSLQVTAADPALRQMLLGLAMAVVAPGLADIGEQAKLMGLAGIQLVEAGSDVVALRANLGAIEARLAQRSVQLSSEQSVLRLAEADLLAVDPYEASVTLEATATRLETLYAVTARLSRMTLAEYLR